MPFELLSSVGIPALSAITSILFYMSHRNKQQARWQRQQQFHDLQERAEREQRKREQALGLNPGYITLAPGTDREEVLTFSNVVTPVDGQDGGLTMKKMNEFYTSIMSHQGFSPTPMRMDFVQTPYEHGDGRKLKAFYDKGQKTLVFAYEFHNGGHGRAVDTLGQVGPEDIIRVSFPGKNPPGGISGWLLSVGFTHEETIRVQSCEEWTEPTFDIV